MSKEIRTGLLLDFYGPLLTGRQQLCLDLYFNQDLSLAEIAGQEGISRQAVRDALVRGERALCEADNVKGRPTCIVMDTVKGEGVSIFKNMGFANHSCNVSAEQLETALAELED